MHKKNKTGFCRAAIHDCFGNDWPLGFDASKRFRNIIYTNVNIQTSLFSMFFGNFALLKTKNTFSIDEFRRTNEPTMAALQMKDFFRLFILVLLCFFFFKTRSQLDIYLRRSHQNINHVRGNANIVQICWILWWASMRCKLFRRCATSSVECVMAFRAVSVVLVMLVDARMSLNIFNNGALQKSIQIFSFCLGLDFDGELAGIWWNANKWEGN